MVYRGVYGSTVTRSSTTRRHTPRLTLQRPCVRVCDSCPCLGAPAFVQLYVLTGSLWNSPAAVLPHYLTAPIQQHNPPTRRTAACLTESSSTVRGSHSFDVPLSLTALAVLALVAELVEPQPIPIGVAAGAPPCLLFSRASRLAHSLAARGGHGLL